MKPTLLLLAFITALTTTNAMAAQRIATDKPDHAIAIKWSHSSSHTTGWHYGK